MATAIEVLPVKLIPTDEIADPQWNSRVTKDGTADDGLVSSIKSEGQKQPAKVVALAPGDQVGGRKYRLVFGSRRLAACRTLNLPLLAMVEPTPAAGQAEAVKLREMLDNATENMTRRDLTPYEQARTFYDLKSAGVKVQDIADKVGLSKQYVSNLGQIYGLVDAKVITFWRDETLAREAKKAAGETDESNVVATVNFLRELVKTPKEQQMGVLEARKAQLAAGAPEVTEEDEESDETEEEETKTKKKPDFKVTRKRYNALIRALSKGKHPAIATAAVKYAVGMLTEIKGVIKDEPEQEADGDE